MRINILEDNLMQQTRIERNLRKAIKEAHFPNSQIFIESNPEDFLRTAELSGTNQLYILDIEIEKFSEKEGLKVAQTIRTFDPQGTIIFITTHENFAAITYKYKVSALGFISKEQSDEELVDELAEYLKHIDDTIPQILNEDLITIGQGREKIQFYPSDLLFIETIEPRKLRVVTKNSRSVVYEKLKTVVDLHQDFMICHRSVLVNTKKIYRIDSKEQLIYFENGDSCIITRRKIGEFQRELKKRK